MGFQKVRKSTTTIAQIYGLDECALGMGFANWGSGTFTKGKTL